LVYLWQSRLQGFEVSKTDEEYGGDCLNVLCAQQGLILFEDAHDAKLPANFGLNVSGKN